MIRLEVWKFTKLCLYVTMISLEVWKLCAVLISLEVYRIVCDDDKFGSLEVNTLRSMMIRLDVWKFTKLCIYVMIISLKVWKLTRCA